MTVGILAILVQVTLIGARVWRERLPVVAVGQPADREVTTPVFLAVVDPDATARAREKESRRLPPLFRFDSRTAERAVERFLADFQQRHTLFQQGLRRKWEAALTPEDCLTAEFADYVAAFRFAHADFPLSDDLAVTWAMDSAAQPWRNPTAAAIRGALRQYVVADELPAEAEGHAEVLLSSPGDAGGVTVAGDVEKMSSRLHRRVMIPLGKVRQQLRGELDRFSSTWADYAAQFVAVNVDFDPAFTAAARAEYAQRVRVEVAFQPGDPLVRAAQPVTVVQATAIEELRSHFAAVAQTRTWTEWWLGGFGLVLVVGGAVAHRAGGPARSREALVEIGSPSSPAVETHPLAMRRGLMHQLSAWVKSQFVQRLIQQRNDALTAQASASEHVEILNDRLTKLDPEIRERVADYERRIAQLERDLSTANEVSRELIKTKISLARKELEIEKARSNLVWN